MWVAGLPDRSFCWKLTNQDPPTMPLARERAFQLAVVLVGHAPCIELIMHFAGTYGAQKHKHTIKLA